MDCRLKHVVVSNYKSIKRTELDDLGNLAVFMGRNNAGKSNILDAFRFVSEAAVNFDQAVADRGGKLSEVIFRKQETGRIEFTFDFSLSWAKRAELISRLFRDNKFAPPEAVIGSNFLATITLNIIIAEGRFTEELHVSNLPPEAVPVLIFSVKGNRESIECTSGNLESLCARCGNELPHQPVAIEPQPQTVFRLHLGNPDTGGRFPIASEIAALVRDPFTALEWIDPLRRLPSSSPIEGSLVIAHDASNLPDVLHWLHNNKPKQFRRIETEIGKLVPQLGRLYTPTVQNSATLGLIDSEDEDLVFSMDQMSFGTRSLIAIVAKVITAKTGSWVCIEEPETYLHPQAQLGLFQFLREESARCRIFLATHSTFIAASCPIHSLFIVHRDRANSTVALPVTPETTLEVIEQLGVKPSFSFEADVIVFVESPEAVPICEAWARKAGLTVKAQFIDIEGATTLHYFANMRVASSKFVHTLVFAIFGGGTHRAELGRRNQQNVVTRLQLPPAQMVTLEAPEIESLLLNAPAMRKAYPAIELSEADLEKKFGEIRTQPGQKEALKELFTEQRLGAFDAVAAGKIAEAMETIPSRFAEFFQQIETESKPFWKI